VAGSSNDHHSEIQIEEHLEKREDVFEEHLEKMIEESEKQQEKEEEEHKTDHGLEEEEEHLKEEEKEFEEQKEQEEEEVQKEKDEEEERLEEKEEHENTKETPGVTPNMHIEVKPIISVNTNGGGLQHILGGCGGGEDCSGCAGNNSGCAEGASHSAANHDFEAMLIEHLDKWMEDHSKSDEPKSDEPAAPVEPVEPVPDYVCDNPDCPEDSLAKCKVYVAGFNEDGELIISKDDEPKEGQNFYVSQCGTCDGSAGLASRSGNVCKPTEPEEKPVEDEKGGDEPEDKALEMAEESFIPEPCPPGSHRVADEEECIPVPCPPGSHRVTEGEDCIPVPCPPGSHRVTPGEECEPEPSSPSAKTVPPDYICHNPECPENQEAKCKVYKAAFSDDGGLVISEEDKLQEGMFYFSSCGTCDDSGHNNRLGNACNPTSEPGVQTSEPGVAEPEAEPENKPTVPADCPDCPEAEPENICFHPDCPDKKCRVYKNAAGAFYSECEACGNSVKSSNIEKFKTVEGTIVTFEGNACTHDLTPTPGAKEKEEEAPPGFQPASAPVEPPPAPYAPPEPCPEGTRGPGDPPCPRAEEVKALEAVLEQKKDEERMENAKKAVLDQEIEFLKGELENDKENLKSDKAELKMETTKLAKYKTDFQQQQEKEEKMHHSKMLAEKQVLKDLQGSFSPVEKILDPVEEEQIKKEENRQAEENQAFEAKQKEEKQFEVKKEEAEEGVIEAEGKRISQLEGKMQEIELSEQSSTENPVFKPY
jgi:chemotaxis protein histidine kinase CheA